MLRIFQINFTVNLKGHASWYVFQKYNIDGSEIFNDSVLLEVLWTKISGDEQQATTSKSLISAEPKMEKTFSESKDTGKDSNKEDSKESTATSARSSPSLEDDKVSLIML